MQKLEPTPETQTHDPSSVNLDLQNRMRAGMVEGSTESVGGLTSGSLVSMGSEGQGEQEGRVSDGSSPTGNA